MLDFAANGPVMTTQRHLLILLLISGTVFLLNLGGARLFDEDEPKNAECGREMFERGDWLVPTYNYELRTDKPIMLYWLMLSSFSAWGVSEFSARLPSAMMSMLTIFCVYGIGRRLFDARVGLWAGVILATTLMFAMISRISTPDATLIGWISLSLLLFVQGVPRIQTETGERSVWQANGSRTGERFVISPTAGPLRWMYAVMGLAVLTKGPVGFLLPCAVIGLFLMCQGNPVSGPRGLSWRRPLASLNEMLDYLAAFWAPSRFWAALRAMQPLWLIAMVCLVALPWYGAVSLVTGGDWLEGFLGDHNLGRFTAPMEDHAGPWFYYVVAILIGFFPWSIYVPISLLLAVNESGRVASRDRLGLLFVLCWAGVYVGFFSLAQTKLPNYVLPAYPALALIAGWMLVRWQEQSLELPGWAFHWSSWSLVIAGVLMGVLFPVVAWLTLPDYGELGLLGVIPLAAGLWMLATYWKTHDWHCLRPRLLPVMGGTAFALVVLGFAVAAPWVSRAQESSQLGLLAAERAEADVPLATYRYFTTNLPFYAQRPVSRYHELTEIETFFKRHPAGMLCLRERDWKHVSESLPTGVKVVEQVPRFLRTENVLMLQRVTQTAAETSAKITH